MPGMPGGMKKPMPRPGVVVGPPRPSTRPMPIGAKKPMPMPGGVVGPPRPQGGKPPIGAENQLAVMDSLKRAFSRPGTGGGMAQTRPMPDKATALPRPMPMPNTGVGMRPPRPMPNKKPSPITNKKPSNGMKPPIKMGGMQ